MAKDKVAIWNMALGFLGISSTVADPDEQSNEARQCRIFYDTVRDLALEEAPWPFAEKRVDLQSVGSPWPGWAYRYSYPNGCVFAREIERSASLPPIPFKIIADETSGGKAILCNQPSAVLIYTARIEDTNIYPMSFVDVVALGLAARIGGPLSAAPGMAEKAGTAYDKAILKAQGRAFNEGEEQDEPECELLSVRR